MLSNTYLNNTCRSIFWVFCFFSVIATTHLFAESGPSVEQAEMSSQLHQDLVRLHQTLTSHAATLAWKDWESGPGESEIAVLQQELEDLTARVHLLGVDGKLLLRKIHQLKPLLANLERALAQDGAFKVAPPGPPRPTIRQHSALGGLENDLCIDASVIAEGTTPGTTTGADNDGQATCGSSFSSPDVWFEFTPTESARVSIDTLGANFDAVLSVHAGCPGTTSNEMTCNDDTFGLDAAVSFFAEVGETYWIRVSGFDGASGDFELHLGPGGTITGRVNDSVTGLPLNDGSVYVEDEHGYTIATTSPAEDGGYEVAVRSGIYFLETNSFDFHLEEVWDDLPCFPNFCRANQGDEVPVPTNTIASGINFSLDPGGTITGLVTDAVDGEPVESALVRIYYEDGTFLDTRYTGNDGIYSMSGLPEATYFASVSNSQYQSEVFDDLPCGLADCVPTSGTPIVIATGETAMANFSLERKGRISGVVTHEASGEPISDLRIQIRNGNNQDVASARTDEEGAYIVGGLSDGTYFAITESFAYENKVWDDIPCPGDPRDCNAQDGAEITVATNETVSGVDFALRRLGSLSGVVTDAVTGALLSGVPFDVYNSSGSYEGGASSNNDGVFQFSHLPEGSYFVRTDIFFNNPTYLNELYDDIPCHTGCTLFSGELIPVALETETSSINFALERAGSIAGVVTDESTGLPISSGEVNLYNSNGSWIDDDYLNSSGEYIFEGLPPGDYYVRTNLYGNFYFDELYDDIPCETCSILSGTPISIGIGSEITGIDFALSNSPTVGPGEIQGEVLASSNGTPLAGVEVVLYSSLGLWVKNTYSDNTGSYSLEGLEPGDYFVRTEDNEGLLDELYDDIPCEPDCSIFLGAAVSVPEGTVTGINFSLEGFGGVSGTVIDSTDGIPQGSITIKIWSSTGELIQFLYTNSSGHYSTDLPAGTYFVSAEEDYPYYFGELWEGIPCPGGAPSGCDVTTGTPVVVESTLVSGIDFEADPPGRVSGRVTNVDTGEPLSGIRVEFWDLNGRFLDSTSTSGNGVYTSYSLPSGTCYVNTDDTSGNYLDELYDSKPCFGGAPEGCDPTKGIPVQVSPGLTTRHIDFDLVPLGDGDDDSGYDFIARVTDENDAPLAGVAIDFWDESGELDSTRYTDSQGEVYRNLYYGDTFYVSTDNGEDLVDEVWQDISCYAGSAYEGLCDPTIGTTVSGDGGEIHILEFQLSSNLPLFFDGFESGDFSAWSTVVPSAP